MLVAYMAWLFYVALGPPPQGPEIPHLDKLMHAFSWGLLAAFCVAAWPHRLRLAVVLAGVHGGLTELLQGTMVAGDHRTLQQFGQPTVYPGQDDRQTQAVRPSGDTKCR